jgi:hypothetical protein
MKKHLPTTGEAIQASAPARLHMHSHGTAGTWQNTAFARIAPVFAPYHQRPKDAVT